jgi:hypothetical protein
MNNELKVFVNGEEIKSWIGEDGKVWFFLDLPPRRRFDKVRMFIWRWTGFWLK